MNRTLRLPENVLPLLAHIFLLPGFFMMSVFLYNPFDIQGYYDFGIHSIGFHIAMLSCIQLLVLSAVRIPLFFACRGEQVNRINYALICFGELLLASFFTALYTELFRHNPGGYFQSLADCLKFTLLILCYPSLFFYMMLVLRNKNEEIETAGRTQGDDSLVRFYDEHKRLKLTIAPSSILYLEARANYVMIHYLDTDKVRDFQLRCSMKSIEKSVSQHGLARCHRSFFVNPAHVRVLRKETDGLTYAELDAAGIPSVPVSRQYYDAVSALL